VSPADAYEMNKTNSPWRSLPRGTEPARMRSTSSGEVHPSTRRTSSSSHSAWKRRGRLRDAIAAVVLDAGDREVRRRRGAKVWREKGECEKVTAVSGIVLY